MTKKEVTLNSNHKIKLNTRIAGYCANITKWSDHSLRKYQIEVFSKYVIFSAFRWEKTQILKSNDKKSVI